MARRKRRTPLSLSKNRVSKTRVSKTRVSTAGVYVAATIAGLCLIGAASLWFGWWSLNSVRARAYPVWGLDVSHHQGRIDWRAVASEPRIRFAYVKATEGDDWSDNTFSANFRNAKNAGLAVGAYHFFSFCSDPFAQVAHFLKTAPPERDSLAPMVDVELGGACRAMGSDSEVRARLRRFLVLLEKSTGRRPVIYATNEAYDRFVKDYGLPNPLWLRDIWHEPASVAGQEWQIWQFANRGHVKGVRGYVDLNVLAGGEAALVRL